MIISNDVKYTTIFSSLLIGFAGGLLSIKIIFSIEQLKLIEVLFLLPTNPLMIIVFSISFLIIGYIYLFVTTCVIYNS